VDDALEQSALVARARRGDADAWEALYRRIHPQLVAYAGRRLDPEAARDAVSEAMARAVARIDRFTWEGGGFDAWIFGILRHVVIDAQRAAKHRVPVEAEDEPPSGEPGPLDLLLGAERCSAVRAAFSRLSAFDQEVLELRVVAGLSSDEVAQVVGKRSGAVRMAQARALERLRELLEEQVTA
jgi:RNA polymerase sigma-70 factor (ECF subfamily)